MKSDRTRYVDTPEVPKDGLCLSSFVLISEKRNAKNVLMGHVNPNAPWDHMGALDPERVEIHRKGWMLPSCHLMLLESPFEAARRVLHEQLGIEQMELTGPQVFSDVYESKRFNLKEHWDLGFIFKGSLDQAQLPKTDAWLDLQFVDGAGLRREEFARSHDDVLVYAGIRPR
jgi:hypothetical protein